MAQTTSITTTYINELLSLVGAIEFTDTGTLTSLGLIFGFNKAQIQKPNSDVCIYEGTPPITSERMDANTNMERFNLNVRIRLFKVNREEQAEEDVRYLREKVIEVLEDNYNNQVWADQQGYLDNFTIQAQNKTYLENHIQQLISFNIVRRRTTAGC